MMTRRTPAVRRSALSLLLDDASTFIDTSGSNDYDYGSGMATESGQRRSLRVAQRSQPTMGSGWNGSGRRYSLRVASKGQQQQRQQQEQQRQQQQQQRQQQQRQQQRQQQQQHQEQQALSSVSFDGPAALISSSWSLREVARHRSSQQPTQSEEVVSDDNSIEIDWNPSNHLERSRRMPNGPLSIELCRARDVYLTKRERRLEVIGQVHHKWNQLSNIPVPMDLDCEPIEAEAPPSLDRTPTFS
jgi:type II secretory pathway pseudopilin PulG